MNLSSLSKSFTSIARSLPAVQSTPATPHKPALTESTDLLRSTRHRSLSAELNWTRTGSDRGIIVVGGKTAHTSSLEARGIIIVGGRPVTPGTDRGIIVVGGKLG